MNQNNDNGSGGPRTIAIVGGGLAGLTAAIACAEGGARVRLLEAHEQLGGRARSKDGPYKANLGPHVIYKDGPFWDWLAERDLLPAYAGPPLSGIRFRRQGKARRTPPLGTIPAVLRLRGREAPIDVDFRSWATAHSDERTAAMLSAAAGVYAFHHDPGELSAAFVWQHTVRVLLSPPPGARYLIGGWGALIDSLERRLRQLGVEVQTGCPVRLAARRRPDDRRHRARPGARAARRRLAGVAGRRHPLSRPRSQPPPR